MAKCKMTILSERKIDGGWEPVFDEEFECQDGNRGVRLAMLGWLEHVYKKGLETIAYYRTLDQDELTNDKNTVKTWVNDILTFDEYYYIEGKRKYVLWGVTEITSQLYRLLQDYIKASYPDT